MQPDENTGKMYITMIQQKGSNNPKLYLDKDFNDTVHIDMLFYGKHYSSSPETETAECVRHYFVDGQYLGSYTLNRGGNAATAGTDVWWTPTALYLYSNSTANVTYSNYKLSVYDENKDIEDLVAQLKTTGPSWRDVTVLPGTGANADFFNISAEIKAGKDGVPEGTKAYAAIYDENGVLLDCDDLTYVTGSTIETKYFDKSYGGKTPKTAKLFIWSDLAPQADVKSVVITPKFTNGDIYVLAIGNSFSKDSVSKINEIAAADGVSIIPYNAFKAGRTLAQHYNSWINDTAEDYRVEPFGVSNGQWKSMREILALKDWDYVMLQGTTHYNELDPGLWGDDPTNTTTYWTTLKDGVATMVPDAKRLVHATWAPVNELAANVGDGMFANGTPDARGAYLTALLPHEQVGAEIYSTEERAGGAKAYIPTAVAVDYLVRHYRFPEYEGERNENNEYDNSDSTRGIYRDTTCHLTDNVGKVLAGLVWYEMITGIPATQNKYQRNTLSASDMAALKDAAHYACRNYATYDPSLITPVPSEEVSATVMKSKNGADATVVFIHDDGARATAEYLNGEFSKYNLNGTVAIIGTNIDDSYKISKWQTILADSNGRLNFASHSYSHKYFGESDDAESGTLSDGTTYSYPAGI